MTSSIAHTLSGCQPCDKIMDLFDVIGNIALIPWCVFRFVS